MKTRRQFLLAIPVFLAYCSSKKKMTEEEIKKLQEGAADYHKNLDKNLLSEGHPIAKTFKYTKDGTTASALLSKSTRAGIPADKQFCNNCIYYTAIGDDYGSCQLLPQGNVTSIGWCFSWAIKKTDVDDAANQPVN